METFLIIGFWLFVITHLDTLVVVGAFCADNHYRTREVLVGHYIGFSIGLVAAVIGAIVATELLQEWTFLLGFVPLSIGVSGFIHRPPEATVEELPTVPNSLRRIGVVTVTAVGLSGENIAVYVPFFVDLSSSELMLIIGLYLIGAGLLFLTALVIVHRVTADGIPDWLDRWLVPTVLVFIGVYVIVTGVVVA